MGDVLIKNGLLVTAEGEQRGDLLTADGLITAIGPDLPAPKNVETYDAQGRPVLPGGVDVHTHLDLTSGQAHVSDGWAAGTLAAAHGGTTAVVEHPSFGPSGCPLDHQLNLYRKNAVEAVIDYGLHGVFQHWDGAVQAALPGLVRAGYPSFKAYLTYDGRLNDEELLAALKALRQAGGLMTVHCENHAVVSHLSAELGRAAPHLGISQARSRPDYAEALAVETAICLAEAAGDAPLYIVHLSTAAGLERVRAAKAAGKRVWAETCPQYLVLTEDRYQQDFETALQFVMAPPLRRAADVEALWSGLLDGSIDTVGTDHCSFAWRDKVERAAGNLFQSPSGVPGVETRLPILYTEGLLKRGLSLSRLAELWAAAPARLFGLTQKGQLTVGREADLVVLDPDLEKTISAGSLHQAVDYTPLAGLKVRGWPRAVFLRGRKIVDEGRFLGSPGQGRFIARQAFSGKYKP